MQNILISQNFYVVYLKVVRDMSERTIPCSRIGGEVMITIFKDKQDIPQNMEEVLVLQSNTPGTCKFFVVKYHY